MRKESWRSQIADGRVFELRSRSTRYPAPCALVIDSEASEWNSRIFTAVDRQGVVGYGLYTRVHNPAIYVDGIRREQFNGSRVLRRRRDLERFDADDLALIRYGFYLDFTGRIHSTSGDIHIPTVVPCDWTVFWLAAWGREDSRWIEREPALDKLLHGAWHFENYGGRRDLGYRFGHAWATRHTGARLDQIRKLLRSRLGSSLIEQPVKVARWAEGENVYTAEIRQDCPALGSRACSVRTPTGWQGIYF